MILYKNQDKIATQYFVCEHAFILSNRFLRLFRPGNFSGLLFLDKGLIYISGDISVQKFCSKYQLGISAWEF